MLPLDKINPYKKVAVIGAGAWGTALSIVAAHNVDNILLYDRDDKIVEDINTNHTNNHYLPKIKLPKNIQAISDLKKIESSELIVIAIPAQIFRTILTKLKEYIAIKTPILICCKGIENNSLELLGNIANSILPKSEIAILSGPNFALEVASNNIAAATIACKNNAIGMRILHSFGTPTYRTYYSDDVIGVQVGGAIKNVIAIAAGIVEGLKLGENAKAALITRGLAEMTKISLKLGGKLETMLGLSGIGDLVLTCGSITSRNMRFGYELAKGKSVSELLASNVTFEGYYTANSVVKLTSKLNIELPICESIYRIIYEHKDITEEIKNLMNRPLKAEKLI